MSNPKTKKKKIVTIGGSGFEPRPINYTALKALSAAKINIFDLKEEMIADAMVILFDNVYPSEAEQKKLGPLSLQELQELFQVVMAATNEAETKNS